MLVADQSIRPEIRDPHFQIVVAGVNGLGNVDAEGRFPRNAKVLAVHEHFRQHFDPAKVQVQPLAASQCVGRDIEAVCIGGGAREVLHAGVSVFGP